MRFLEVDGEAGDEVQRAVRSKEMCQCGNARLLALCRCFGTGKIANPGAEQNTQFVIKRLRKQAGWLGGTGPVFACVVEAWSASFPIAPRLRSAPRQPSSFERVRSKYDSAHFLQGQSEYPCLPAIRAFYPGSHCCRCPPEPAVIEFRSAAHLKPGPPIESPRAQSHSGALECCLANGIAASV